MLPQLFSRHGERETRRRGVASSTSARRLRVPVSPFLRVAITAIAFLLAACGSKPTDPRTVIPGDALIYLESQDLGKTLTAITDNPKFQQLAANKPDLSPLDGVKVSIAVTGFETSEQPVTEENAVLNFRPRVVAVAETNAWDWQTSNVVEHKLGDFVTDLYGGEVEVDVTPRQDGTFYTWTSTGDGRKAYALQQGSLILFGNDESAIDRCLAVKRGEVESIAKNQKVLGDGDRLAFAYVSPEGVGQLANILGVTMALGASEEEEVKSFVATVLPEILRSAVKEVTWTATKTDAGIEDKVAIKLDDESSHVLDTTIVPGDDRSITLAEFAPAQFFTVTRYRLRDPQIAWRSVVLTAKKKTDETSGALIAAYSGSVFEPYGIEDPETFLSAIGPHILTVKATADPDDVAVIAKVKDAAKIRAGVAKEIDFKLPPEKQFGGDYWKSADGEVGFGTVGDVVIVGDAGTVLKCLEAKQSQPNSELAQTLAASDAAAMTYGVDPESIGKLVEVFAERRNENEQIPMTYRTETRFNANGLERRTISDFGLIGEILENLDSD